MPLHSLNATVHSQANRLLPNKFTQDSWSGSNSFLQKSRTFRAHPATLWKTQEPQPGSPSQWQLVRCCEVFVPSSSWIDIPQRRHRHGLPGRRQLQAVMGEKGAEPALHRADAKGRVDTGAVMSSNEHPRTTTKTYMQLLRALHGRGRTHSRGPDPNQTLCV